jgi:hypothetical protein
VAQVLVQIRKPEQKLQEQLFLPHAVIRAVLREKIHGKVRMFPQFVQRFWTDNVFNLARGDRFFQLRNRVLEIMVRADVSRMQGGRDRPGAPLLRTHRPTGLRHSTTNFGTAHPTSLEHTSRRNLW